MDNLTGWEALVVFLTFVGTCAAVGFIVVEYIL